MEGRDIKHNANHKAKYKIKVREQKLLNFRRSIFAEANLIKTQEHERKDDVKIVTKALTFKDFRTSNIVKECLSLFEPRSVALTSVAAKFAEFVIMFAWP